MELFFFLWNIMMLLLHLVLYFLIGESFCLAVSIVVK